MLYVTRHEFNNKYINIEVLNSWSLRLSSNALISENIVNSRIQGLLFRSSITDKEGIDIFVGQNLSINFPSYCSAFYVYSITKIGTSYVIYTCKQTKAKHFILPSLGESKSFLCFDDLLENVYLEYTGVETEGLLFGSALFLRYRVVSTKSFTELDAKLLKHSSYVGSITDDYHITYLMKISPEFKDDITKFIEGKYSKLSDKLKNLILSFHGYDKTGITGQILYNHPLRRKQLEIEFGQPLPRDIEVYDIPVIEQESYLSELYTNAKLNKSLL